MSDSLSILISFCYIAVAVALCLLLDRAFSVPSVIVRKLLHMLSALWVILMAYGFESAAARALGPVLFIFINALYAYRKEGRLDSGLVTFPVSLLIVSLLFSFGYVSADTAISSMLVLGCGDGAAAVTGYFLHKTGKSIEGSISMFLVSMVVLLLFSSLALPWCILVSLAATVAERVTPYGLDNLTVPLTSALLMEVICVL